MAKMTEKQKKFCDFYIISGHATQAAIDAGYSKKTAYAIGCENLTKPLVKEYLKLMIDKADKERREQGKIQINTNLYKEALGYFNDNNGLLVEFIESKILAKIIKQDQYLNTFKKRRTLKKDGKYFLLHKAGFKCQACGNKPAERNEIVLHIDHIIPFSLGGSNDYDNLQVLCNECNYSKSNSFSINHNYDN